MHVARSSAIIREIAATVGKLALAAGVFVAIIAGYFFFISWQHGHSPLPGRIAAGGRCTVWLVGSSSLHRWDSAERDLAGWTVYNRGIEGARLPELALRLGRTGGEPAPAAIVLYAGENDIADGTDPAAVSRGLVGLAKALRARAPDSMLLIVSMKPSPTRWLNRPAQLAVDAAMRRFAASQPRTAFVPAGEQLLVGARPGNFYHEDGIHLVEEGYRRWSRPIATGLRQVHDKDCN
ncbi:GDSL-type esterase/lipase family protein [Sphingomonas sp. TZW2008]|uniref:GDSL-type esterase/lipase family protein n=1 Tax=Sphingomonas sp. TZW2008 TaxID=1917973 RepID=UPI000A272210|nr:GDSL-type esterase/lipase family protein [Sphingomonas sp. TZW2008]